MELRGQRVLVVGLGKSGLSAARVLRGAGADVIVNDLRDEPQLGDAGREARALGASFQLGAHDVALFTSVDRIVISPGVPPLPALDAAAARGIPILSEVELAAYFIQPGATVVGVTGTNGKSTVTTLVGEMCQHSGRPTFVGGNLGTPFCDVAGTPAAQSGYVVVELSSYQLERVETLRIGVGALLNITEDHLDRYPTFDAYVAAKARLFQCQRAGDAAVVQAGDALCEKLAAAGPAKVFKFAGRHGAVRVEDGAIIDDQTGKVIDVSALRIRGVHNLQNACAAALCARLAGVPAGAITATLGSFAGLPHRMAFVANLGGVDYYDDSKATNVGATVAALDGLAADVKRIVLIAGGKDKGGDYGPMRDRLAACGRAVVLIGEARPIIERALAGAPYPIEAAASMEDAVQRARRLAQAGDAVLLAPACASFDMFRSYAHRGDVFQDAVRQLRGGV